MKKWMGYAVVILWLAAAAKYITGAEMTEESRVAKAFAQAEFAGTECSLHLAGPLEGEAGKAGREKALLTEIAGALGLYTGYEIRESEQEGRQIIELYKEMPQARVSLREVILPEGPRYLYLKLDFYRSTESGLYYKEKLEQVREDYGLEASVTLQQTGVYEGSLDREAKDRIAGQILESMGAAEQESYREEDLYTIYAYTDSWPEYTTVSGRRVNVNLAFSYDERSDKTYVYLGSPLILSEY